MSYVFIHPIEQFTIVDSLDGFQMKIPTEAPPAAAAAESGRERATNQI